MTHRRTIDTATSDGRGLFMSTVPGEARSLGGQGGPKGLSADPGAFSSCQEGRIIPITDSERSRSLPSRPSVRLRDFPRSHFDTDIERRRAFQRAYYAVYRKIHWLEKRQGQQKYLLRSPWQNHYKAIKVRCRNPRFKDYAYYGGRGVRCFLTLQDVKFLWFRDRAFLLRNPSIDRRDPDGHYTVDNCRFIEHAENSRQGGLKHRKGKGLLPLSMGVLILLLFSSPVLAAPGGPSDLFDLRVDGYLIAAALLLALLGAWWVFGGRRR